MNKFNRIIVGKNVKALREEIGISQHDFSSIIDISKRSLASIELGATNISADLLASISSFYNLSLDDLSNTELKVSENFRDEIINLHKNNPAYQIVLKKRPNLNYAINFKLLRTSFLNKSKEITDIKQFFEKHGWVYLGTSISNALKREKDKIQIDVHPTKKGTFIYSRK